jgi:predicted metal-dependent RNase
MKKIEKLIKKLIKKNYNEIKEIALNFKMFFDRNKESEEIQTLLPPELEIHVSLYFDSWGDIIITFLRKGEVIAEIEFIDSEFDE